MLVTTTAEAQERVLTASPHGHLIHNRQIFSPDGRFIYYDSRNDETLLATSTFIGRVEITSGNEEILYQIPSPSAHGPGVGAVTCNPISGQVAFIHGLANASAAEPYAPHRRSGFSLSPDGSLVHLDARDITPPLTAGALSGGTHAFHWSPDGRRLSFTYNDALIPIRSAPTDLRTVGIMIPGQRVVVNDPLPAVDFSGDAFSTLVVPVTDTPTPGSDEILRAFDEGWLSPSQLAFQGIVRGADGKDVTELFLATLPALPGAVIPRQGLPPAPPEGVAIRRLTHTGNRKYPGIQGPRHWVRPSPDRSLIAFLAKDEQGLVQIFAVHPSGGPPEQLSRLAQSVETPFDWSPDSKLLACASGGRIQVIDASSGRGQALTPPSPASQAPLHGVCFSPDGRHLAYNRRLKNPDGGAFLQICLLPIPPTD